VTIYDSRAQVRAALAAWPDCSTPTRAWLDALPWRVRQCVLGVHGDRRTADAVACVLGISVTTVRADLRVAYETWQQDHDIL
jgi:DNA-directed RNA polymerase specialized sigma24 family protein